MTRRSEASRSFAGEDMPENFILTRCIHLLAGAKFAEQSYGVRKFICGAYSS